MRYLAYSSFVVMGFALAANNVFGAGVPSGSHVPGIPSTGSQNGFGRSGINNPVSAGTGTPGTTGTTGSATGSGSSSFSNGPSSGGTSGAPSTSGSSFGTGSVNDQNSPYPMTLTPGGGAVPNNTPNGTASASGSHSSANPADTANSAGSNNGSANGAAGIAANPKNYRQIGYYQGRWWYPLGSGQWVYWDTNTSSWVFFPNTNTDLANSADMSAQHSSGYRGLDNANANGNVNGNANGNAKANTTPPSNTTAPSAATASPAANRWYFRDGKWMWFNGQTFQPAQ